MRTALFLCIALGLPAVWAQTDSGSIRVLAADSAGLAIGDAKVELVNTATAFRLSRNTSTDGYATFTPLPAGAYTVEVSKAGFQQTCVNDCARNQQRQFGVAPRRQRQLGRHAAIDDLPHRAANKRE